MRHAISAAPVVARASFDDDAAIAMLLVAQARVRSMTFGGLATVPTTAHDARDQVQGSEAFRGVDLDLPKPATSMPLRRHRLRRLYVDAARCGAYSWPMTTSSSVTSPPAGDREIVQEPAALIDRAADWLMEQALGQTALDDLFRGCCERLLGAGIPLSRATSRFACCIRSTKRWG